MYICNPETFHPSVYISATYRYQYNIELAFEER
jgi:hypothetical protein